MPQFLVQATVDIEFIGAATPAIIRHYAEELAAVVYEAITAMPHRTTRATFVNGIRVGVVPAGPPEDEL